MRFARLPLVLLASLAGCEYAGVTCLGPFEAIATDFHGTVMRNGARFEDVALATELGDASYPPGYEALPGLVFGADSTLGILVSGIDGILVAGGARTHLSLRIGLPSPFAPGDALPARVGAVRRPGFFAAQRPVAGDTVWAEVGIADSAVAPYPVLVSGSVVVERRQPLQLRLALRTEDPRARYDIAGTVSFRRARTAEYCTSPD